MTEDYPETPPITIPCSETHQKRRKYAPRISPTILPPRIHPVFKRSRPLFLPDHAKLLSLMQQRVAWFGRRLLQCPGRGRHRKPSDRNA